MEITKCSFCSKEVGEVGKVYYETWEKRGAKRKLFAKIAEKSKKKIIVIDPATLRKQKDTFLNKK